MMSETTRRSVLAGAAGVGAAAVLAACGTADNGSGSGDGVNDNAGDSGAQTTPTAAPESHAPDNSGGNTGGNVLAKTTDIPVGGGKIIDAEKVVVTQPSKGTFKCFSAVCTHAGCTVSGVSNGIISCPCHGSRFSAA